MKIQFILAVAFLLAIPFAYSAINDELHLNIQLVDGSGTVETGTYNFTFTITTGSDCTGVLFTNSSELTTDSRGIISYYLQNVALDFTDQYYLCTYRGGVLKDASKMARAPYAYTAKNISASGIIDNSNINLSTHNITASQGLMNLNWSYLLNVPSLFTNDSDVRIAVLNITTTVYVDVKCSAGEVLTSNSATGEVSCTADQGSSIGLQNETTAWKWGNESLVLDNTTIIRTLNTTWWQTQYDVITSRWLLANFTTAFEDEVPDCSGVTQFFRSDPTHQNLECVDAVATAGLQLSSSAFKIENITNGLEVINVTKYITLFNNSGPGGSSTEFRIWNNYSGICIGAC